jgi:nitrate/nitrite transporter NarK
MATSNGSTPNGSLREPSPDQPLSQLISRTSSDLATLFRKEVELAKIEIRDDVRHTAKAGSMFGAAGFAGYLAAVLASLAVVFALDLAMPLWAAFLIVAVLFAFVCFVLFRQARTRMSEFKLGPEQTIETIKEDIEWAKARSK